MGIADSLKARRSIYKINRTLPVDVEQVTKLVTEITELVPDAFNMHSQRVVIALGEKNDALWDAIYNAFGGKVSRERTDGFKAGAGTVLYFYDANVVKNMQEQYASYAANFPIWAQQANGMLQLSVWAGLRELGIGANIQHYNPVIDNAVKELFDLPDSYVLVAQMPFGGIVENARPKEGEDISRRVTVVK